MHRRSALFLLTPLLMPANAANTRDARLETLYPQFIAPCCWRENLSIHRSPKADELRAEIKQLVDAGKPDDEIRAEFTRKYSMRILSEPEGARAQWLWWTPIGAALTGLAAVTLIIRRSLSKAPTDDAISGSNP